MTRNIWTNFRSPILRSLHTEFEFNWPSGFRGEDVWKCWRTDGRRSHWYTNSSPRSLRLRWAKNYRFSKPPKSELTLVLLNLDLSFFENTVDPDQMASLEAIWSGSILSSTLIEKNMLSTKMQYVKFNLTGKKWGGVCCIQHDKG